MRVKIEFTLDVDIKEWQRANDSNHSSSYIRAMLQGAAKEAAQDILSHDNTDVICVANDT
tara:strand:- start:123 stop:302 length:180 start_codon:yes stop_codon:yes gene_type:complete